MTNSTPVGRERMRARRALLCATTSLLAATMAAPSDAQVAASPPARPAIDGNGVDLRLGTMNVDGPVLSAGGSGAQGLAWRKFNHGGGWGDTLVATLSLSGSTALVSFGTSTDRFSVSGSTYTSTEGDGGTLSLSGNIYTYTAADGTIAHFSKIYVGTYPYGAVAAIVTDVTQPSGEHLTYGYHSETYCSKTKPGASEDVCTAHNTAYRISSVSNNSQYQLNFAYGNWDGLGFEYNVVPDGTTLHDWGDITGVSMTNVAVTGARTRSQSFAPSYGGGYSYFTVTDAMSRATSYRSGSYGLAGITRAGSSSEDVTVTYDTAGRVASVTNAAGTTTYGYADTSTTRTTTVTDPLAHATVYVFDLASSRMTALTNAVGKTTAMQYDTAGRLTRTTAPEGNYVQTTYDARGNATETRAVAKSGSGLADIVTTASYDTSCTNAVTCNSPAWTKDARGNQTDYTYDTTTGEVLSITAPGATATAARPKTSYTYTTVNGVSLVATSSTCQTGSSCAGTADEVKTSVAYDGNGLPTSVTRQAGDGSLAATLTTAYDDVGNAVSVDGPLAGNADTVTYRYDADREPVGAIAPDPDGSGPRNRRATRTTYDADGRATVVELGTVTGTDDSAWSGFSALQSVTTGYDTLDRPVRRTLAAGGSVYGVTQLSYDHQRLDCVATRLNPAAWGFDTASACTAQAAGSAGPDRIVKYTYDAADRATVATSAYGVTGVQSDEVTAAYSDNGQTLSVTDAEGNKTGYAYDGFDRLATTSYPSPTKGSGTVSSTDYEQLGYDAGGNVTSRRLRDGNSIAYSYDNLNRLTLKDLPGSDPDVSYTYDLLGRPLSASNSAQTLSFTWDALSRNVTQTGPQGTVTSAYDVAGRRTQLTYPGGTFYVTYDYDAAGQMTAIKESGTTALATFAYDDLGRRTTLTRGNGVVTSYGYDGVSRLTSLGLDLAGTADDLTLGFAYNPASQIASTTRSNDGYAWTGAATGAKSYTSNGLNQYGTAGGSSLSYDARGNTTAIGSAAYAYSSENLLLTGPNSAALIYDPLMRLYQTGASGYTTTRFAYDGQAMIGEYDTSGTLLKRYVHGTATDEPLVEYDGSGTRTYLAADERGSIVSRSNASGAVTARNTYDEYGTPGASNVGRYGYTGQTWLFQIGLSYYKARMYAPALGRFLQTDPIGYGDGLNRYNYVGGDPINYLDSSGLDEESDDIVVTNRRIHVSTPGICDTSPWLSICNASNNFFGNSLFFENTGMGGAGAESSSQNERWKKENCTSDGRPKYRVPSGYHSYDTQGMEMVKNGDKSEKVLVNPIFEQIRLGFKPNFDGIKRDFTNIGIGVFVGVFLGVAEDKIADFFAPGSGAKEAAGVAQGLNDTADAMKETYQELKERCGS